MAYHLSFLYMHEHQEWIIKMSKDEHVIKSQASTNQ